MTLLVVLVLPRCQWSPGLNVRLKPTWFWRKANRFVCHVGIQPMKWSASLLKYILIQLSSSSCHSYIHSLIFLFRKEKFLLVRDAGHCIEALTSALNFGNGFTAIIYLVDLLSWDDLRTIILHCIWLKDIYNFPELVGRLMKCAQRVSCKEKLL